MMQPQKKGIGEQMVSVNSGFTLIELMVVLAIMAIITLVAYPSYQQSMRKARRSDGIAAALTLQVAQEKFRANCPVYAAAFDTTAPLANTCVTTSPNTSAIVADSASPEGFYTLSITGTSTGNAYAITATAQGAQADDTGCTAMVITFNATNPNGAKTPAECWP